MVKCNNVETYKPNFYKKVEFSLEKGGWMNGNSSGGGGGGGEYFLELWSTINKTGLQPVSMTYSLLWRVGRG